MKTLYLVDGSGYIFRAYFAISPLSTSTGFPTNALFGFTRMLVKLLRDVSAKHIAVTFDTAEPTFRHQRYEDYKANREECPEDLVPQMPYFRKITEALGIKVLEKPGFEADDIIATITEKFKSVTDEIIIVSGDKDLTQLVNDHVRVWDAMRDINYDKERVKEKFGVRPDQMVDYLALVGDSSDNVPGVKGIGPKTAQQLIAHFGSLETLIENRQEIEKIQGLRGASGVLKRLESSLEQLRLSKELIELDKSVEPFNKMESVEQLSWTSVQPDLADKVFQELEFSNMLDSLLGLDNTKSKQLSTTDEQNKYKIIDETNFDSFIKELKQQKCFSFDTETTSLDVLTCELAGISFSWKEKEAYYLPLLPHDNSPHLNADSVRLALQPILNDTKVLKVGANLKFDISVLAESGYEVTGPFFDLMLASYVLNPDRRQHGLKALTRQYLKEEMVPYEELVGDKSNIAAVPLAEVYKYACHDADATFRLYLVFSDLLQSEKQNNDHPSPYNVFMEIEMPLVPVLSAIERTGFRIDKEFLLKFSEELQIDLQQLEQTIYSLTGVTFNINSPKQLSDVLFINLGIPTYGIKKTQSAFSTDASVLSKLAPKYEIVAKILEYRELFKLKTTYLDGLTRYIHPKTGRIHSSLNQAVAATGRLSSSEPNLQNIPIRGERGREVRKAFIAQSGFQLISADYSQIELRILAHLSGDENLRAAFVADEDIHLATARELFGALALNATQAPKLRRVAKTINFGIIYGIGAFRLANDLGIPRAQAQKYIDEYFARYPRVRNYLDNLMTQSEEVGYVETLYGRKRYRKDIEIVGRDKGYADRSLMNFPIQGSAAEVMKRAMIVLFDRLAVYGSQARMILQVHDELIIEAADSVIDEIVDTVRHAMETAVRLSVPLKVDVSVGQSWGEKK